VRFSGRDVRFRAGQPPGVAVPGMPPVRAVPAAADAEVGHVSAAGRPGAGAGQERVGGADGVAEPLRSAEPLPWRRRRGRGSPVVVPAAGGRAGAPLARGHGAFPQVLGAVVHVEVHVGHPQQRERRGRAVSPVPRRPAQKPQQLGTTPKEAL